MALEDFRDQVKEKLGELWGAIQESPAYNNAQEKFEALSPGSQKGIILGSIVLVFVILISVPIGYFSSASSSVSEYENTRQLIRALWRASRLANESSALPTSLSADELKARLQNDLASFNLLPEQVGGVSDLEVDKMGAPLAPKSINQSGVGLSLKKLNLKQVVDIGFQLQQINPSVKLAGLEVLASSPDPHYFDALYKLIIYSLPMNLESEEGGGGGRPPPFTNPSGPGSKGNRPPPRGSSAKGPQGPPPNFRNSPANSNSGSNKKNNDDD